MMERMERTGTDLAVTGYVFEPSGRIIQCDSWGIPSVIRNCTDGGMHFLIDSQFFNMVWNKMFRADIIHNRRIRFDEKVHYGEDGIFLMKYLAAVNSVSVDDAPMYHYRFRMTVYLTIQESIVILINWNQSEFVTIFFRSGGCLKNPPDGSIGIKSST
jgi:hypothetical protein